MFLKRIAIAVCCHFTITGQAQVIQRVSINDSVLLNRSFSIINAIDSSLPSSTIKEDLVIFDFWATWCSSCIVTFPHLDSLQSEFAGKLQVFLVNWDETDLKIRSFLEKYERKQGKKLGLPIVAGDTVLRQLFPHQTLPHYAWMYKGKLLATTAPEMVTADRIGKVLANEKVSFKMKKDVMDFNAHQLLLDNGNGGSNDRQLFRSLFTLELEGLRGGYQFIHDSLTQRYLYVNFPVLGLYQQAYSFDYNRMILAVKDPLRYAGSSPAVFSYELTVPNGLPKTKVVNLMRLDLDRYTGLVGRMEKRMVDCYVLTKKDRSYVRDAGESKVWDNEDHSILFLRNFPFRVFFRDLNFSTLDWPPHPILIDETYYNGNISLDLPTAAKMDMEQLAKVLQEQGFILTKGRRVVEMFVLRE